MSSNYIEVMRINHVRLEGFEMAISKELDQKPNGVSSYVFAVHDN